MDSDELTSPIVGYGKFLTMWCVEKPEIKIRYMYIFSDKTYKLLHAHSLINVVSGVVGKHFPVLCIYSIEYIE